MKRKPSHKESRLLIGYPLHEIKPSGATEKEPLSQRRMPHVVSTKRPPKKRS